MMLKLSVMSALKEQMRELLVDGTPYSETEFNGRHFPRVPAGSGFQNGA